MNNLNSPIFIVGSPRSGTTLLQVLISTFQNIAIPPEDDFIIRFYNKCNGNIHRTLNENKINELLDDLFYHDGGTFLNWQVSRDKIFNKIQEERKINLIKLINIIYKAFLDRFPGKNRWGCKVPYFSLHIKTLNKIFPDAYFINMFCLRWNWTFAKL